MIAKRTLVASLTLTASALVGLAVHEGYREEAYIPVKGDRRYLTGVNIADSTDQPLRSLA
jgi:lysozyme